MKKMLMLLMVMLCVMSVALAEANCPLEFRMELSQVLFDEPGEVTVTIEVANVSGADMPGPMALYWPSGRIIQEFGTPTLLADETRTWQGTWDVSAEQLNAGRVIFAAQYTRMAADGSLERKVQTFYTEVAWEEKPAQTAQIVLKGNPTTGYSWDWQGISGDSCIKVSCEIAPVNDDPELVGGPMKYTYVIEGTQPGYVELCFTYARPWDVAGSTLYQLYYDVRVDEDLNVTILSSRFDW